MPRDHLEIGVDQHRDIEPKCLDASGKLPDLLFAASSGVPRIRLQQIDRTMRYIEG